MDGKSEARFWSNVLITDQYECWEWQGCDEPYHGGYARFWYEGQTYYASRLSWVINHGDVPEGMVVCHSCDNRKCVSPFHLWLGTQAENIRDMVEKGRDVNSKKRYCRNEHPFNAENTYTLHGHRYCRTCDREKHQRYRQLISDASQDAIN